MSSSTAQYENDQSQPAGAAGAGSDNDYALRPGQAQSGIPVQKDEAAVESGVNPATEDSDEQLAKDDNEAIDQSNIIGERTRGAVPSGGYREPGDEEGLPTEDGSSSVA